MGLPLLPEEEILPVFLSLEIPSVDLLDPEKEMIRKFRMYFTKTWIYDHRSFSVFYYENATNNGAESYHKTINTYIKVSHPNIWNFLSYLNNIISDFDLELQRLKEGHATTRGSNSVTNAKREIAEMSVNNNYCGFLSPIEYHNAVSLTIGRDDYNLGTVQPLVSDISENLSDDSNENVDESEYCHVCLFLRSENFALLHDDFVHSGFCKTCANHLWEMKATCPICRNTIKGVLGIFQ